jgi:N-acetylmuramoyl-L-alanine amidase
MLVGTSSAFGAAKVTYFIDSLQREVVGFKNVNKKKDIVKPPYQIKKVVIDAGHGGHDPGCVGSKSKEKDIALAIALQTGQKIKSLHPDVEVIYTRISDVFLPLHTRASIANKAEADVFISIHCNSVANNKPYGTETFVLGLHKAKENLEVAKRENQVIFFEEDYKENYGGYDPNSPEGHIFLSFMQNAFLKQSISLAEQIENNFKSYDRHSRGVKQGGLLVLKHATMPAVLVEVGFLSNPDEEAYLMTSKGKDQMAQGIANAFSSYKMRSEAFSSDWIANKSTTPDSGIENGIVEFCVQFASGSTNNVPEIKTFKTWGTLRIREEGKTYKYQIGNLPSYEAALEKRAFIQSKGYKDAFVVAYRHQQKISIQEAMTLSNGTADAN